MREQKLEHNHDIRMRSPLPFITKLLFVGVYALGCVGFNLFLNWYDTGQLSADALHFASMALTGVVFGILALMIEVWLNNKYGYWPRNRLPFFLRLSALTTMFIDLSFVIGSGPGQPFSAMLFVGLFYSLMVVPFGLAVGLTNGLLLRRNSVVHSSQSKTEGDAS